MGGFRHLKPHFQSAFGEIGAGVGLGIIYPLCEDLKPNKIKGANSIAALEKIGVLDAIVRKSDDKTIKPRGFEFYWGDKTHDLIYKVFLNPIIFHSLVLSLSSTRSVIQHLDLESTGR